jgi:hypothetical protein
MIFTSHFRPGDLVIYFQVTTKYFLVSVRGGMQLKAYSATRVEVFMVKFNLAVFCYMPPCSLVSVYH